VRIVPESSSFSFGGPSRSARSGGAIFGTGYLVPQSFATGENPGYKTPTVALRPSVERVVGVVHSTGGRIGSDMSLRVPLQDSVVRLWV
jgi:hypothetical protein